MSLTTFMSHAFENGQSCEKTTSVPVVGLVEGKIPSWLEGTLICNGPGIYKVGEDKYNHFFDGLSILHRYQFKKGQVTYTSRDLESDTYKRNLKAERIVVSEFGTVSFPDPCKTFMERLLGRFSVFTAQDEEMTDNCNVSVAYYGDQLYAMTETNLVRRIDPKDLSTIGEKTRITDYVAVNQATAHPHILPDGSVLNMGNNYRHKSGPHYCIFKVSPSHGSSSSSSRSETCFKETKLVAEIPCSSWRYPCYYHSFGVTQNHVVFIESPLRIDVLKVLKGRVMGQPISTAMFWDPRLKTKFHVVSLQDGKRHPVVFETEGFFTFHHINAYEENSQIVVDVAAYKTGSVLSSLLESKERSASVEEGSARRFFLPLESIDTNAIKENKKIQSSWPTIYCEPHYLTQDWIDFPRINYKYNGVKYNFFYGMAFTKVRVCNERQNPKNWSTSETEEIESVHCITKVDIQNNQVKKWWEVGKIPSEPIFVPSPTSTERKRNPASNPETQTDEDDGILLVSLLHKEQELKPKVTLVVLDARELTENARITFEIAGNFTGSFHGQWAQEGNNIHVF